MYKYVQRRLKDIVERTYTFLDVKKSWTCQDKQHLSRQVAQVKPSAVACLNHSAPASNGASSFAASPNGEKCRKEKHYHPDYSTWISAITWSSALVCGWYASQLLCLHRRHVGWDTRCYYSKLFLQPSRALHSRVARIALVPFSRPDRLHAHSPHHQPRYMKVTEEQDLSTDSGVASSERAYSPPADIFEDHHEFHDLHQFVQPVGNDFMPKPKPAQKPKPTVESAVKNLLTVLGEIEFELGVKSLSVGDFQTAVSHLKLATSHHHAGATFNLGICFEQGLGVKQDMRLAMECYQAAAELGHAKAMYNLGVFYASGLGGLSKSRKAARRCFVAAAQLGVTEARLALGIPVVTDEIPSGDHFGAILKPVFVS